MAALFPKSPKLSKRGFQGDGHNSLKRLKDIMREETGVTAKWYDIGMELLDSTVPLDEIQANYPHDVNKCCTEMFKKWLQCKSNADWDQLASVLCKVGLSAAAENIKNIEKITESSLGTMVDDEVEYIEKQLNARTIVKLKGKYASVTVKLRNIFENKKLDVQSLILELCSLDDENITIFSTDSAFKKILSITELFHHIGQYCSIYDYELLVAFVESTECQEAIKLLDDFTKELHSSILCDLDLLCKDGELRDPKDFMPGSHKLVIKYVKGICTLKTKELVQNIICECFHLKKGSIIFKGVQEGCVAFMYQISLAVKCYLQQQHSIIAKNLFFEGKIKCIIIDDEELSLKMPVKVLDSNKPTLEYFNRHVRSLITARWEDVAVQLLSKEHQKEIDIIKANHHGDVEKCCSSLFTIWSQRQPEGVTWRVLIEAIRNAHFTNEANQIEKLLMTSTALYDVEEPETSVTVGSKVGGYDCDFVETPADDLLCRICQYPARDPVLTVCCGHNICTTCLEHYLHSRYIDHVSCPYCREKKFEAKPDKRTQRLVFICKVFCPHKHLGCTWIGELRSLEDHVNENSNNTIGCPFTELQCSNGCGVVMQRRLVEGHLKSECELREVKCEYCNTTGSYQWINSDHHEECPKYPVECPNHCEVGHMRREEIRGHLEECPLAIVECPYAGVGCESVVRRKEEMEHVMGSVGQHMEYNKNTILCTKSELEWVKVNLQDRLDAKEKELQSTKKDLEDAIVIREKELENVKRDLLASLNDKEQAIMNNKSAILHIQNELECIKKNLQDILDNKEKDLQRTNDRLDAKEKELQSVKKDLEATKSRVLVREQELADIKKDLQARSNINDEAIEKELQDTREKFKASQEMQYQLKKTIDDKEREFDEMRMNMADNIQTLNEMMHRLKNRLEETEKSLQHQLNVTMPLFESMFGSKRSMELNSLANSGNQILPVIFKLTDFERYKKNDGNWDSPGFYTKEGGYQMYMKVFPNGFNTVGAHGSHVSIWVPLMKGDHDDHLTWPVKGTLTVQLLNQLSDDNHSELVKFQFDGSSAECQRVKQRSTARSGVWCFQFIPHKKLSHDSDKRCQYLKDDCVFFRVCDFQ